jgi:hypothetical protein
MSRGRIYGGASIRAARRVVLLAGIVQSAVLCAAQMPAAVRQDVETPAACMTAAVGPQDMAGKKGPHFPDYMDDTFQQLKIAVPTLRGLKFEGHSGTEPDESSDILAQTGVAISTMLQHIPHMIAKEELWQAMLHLPYSPQTRQDTGSMGGTGGRRSAPLSSSYSTVDGTAITGDELQKTIEGLMVTKGSYVKMNYRIQADPDPELGMLLLNEYRTNLKNEPIANLGGNPGDPQSVGLGNTWLLFDTRNLKEARFRYLGKQKLGKHETFVVAFAQLPETVTLPAQISMSGVTCSYMRQGVLWIDQTLYQILRLETDLLAPLPGIKLDEVRTEVDFAEVRIPERNLSLWLPKELEVLIETEDQATVERHRYSEYRLLTATSRIILPDEE